MKDWALWLSIALATSLPCRAQSLSAFDAGLADRTVYENWLSSLAGDSRDGATYWAAHRSVLGHASCLSAGVEKPREWVAGCSAADSRLSPSDIKRKADPDYRRGWNSFTQPNTQEATTSAQAHNRTITDALGFAQASMLERYISGCRLVTEIQDRVNCYDSIKVGVNEHKIAPAPETSPSMPSPANSHAINSSAEQASAYLPPPPSTVLGVKDLPRLRAQYGIDNGDVTSGPDWLARFSALGTFAGVSGAKLPSHLLLASVAVESGIYDVACFFNPDEKYPPAIQTGAVVRISGRFTSFLLPNTALLSGNCAIDPP